MKTSKHACQSRRFLARFVRDTRGLAAVEFAFIVPLMLTMIFGTIEVSSGVAIDRKVTMAARTISDLVSQGPQVSKAQLKNYFGLGSAILTPYPVTPTTMTQTITEISIDASKNAKVVWSYTGLVTNGTSADPTIGRSTGAVVTAMIPAGLLVPNTQLIWSEVKYFYTPIVGYVVQGVGGIVTLSDECFTRPRQSDAVSYSAT